MKLIIKSIIFYIVLIFGIYSVLSCTIIGFCVGTLALYGFYNVCKRINWMRYSGISWLRLKFKNNPLFSNLFCDE